MARRLPPLKALRVFEAAARLGSFTAAAEDLCITHSAVSQQIRMLEEYAGRSLFAREARGVTLLADARDYFAEVQVSLDRIEAATAALKSPQRRLGLQVGITPSLAMKWLIPRLADFQQQFRDIEVRVTTLSRHSMDQAEVGNDVIVRRMPMQRQGHVCVRCLDDFSLPVASPRFMDKHRIKTAADCLGHPLLQVASGTDHWPRWFDMAGVRVPSLLPGPVFDHQFLSMQAAVNDLGLALAPWCLLEEDIRADRLRPLFAQPRMANAGVHALYRADSPVAPLAQQFIAWLSQQGNPVPWPA